MFEPGDEVEVVPDQLWYYDFETTEGTIKDSDVVPEYYIVRLKKPALYGVEHKMREISVHQSQLREMSKRQKKRSSRSPL